MTYIIKEDLIEELKYVNNDLPLFQERDWDVADGFDKAIEVVEKFNPPWFSVEEYTPDEKGNYLVVYQNANGPEVHEAYYYAGEWYDPVENYEKYPVTHWMPLPELPKDGEA